MVFHCPQKNNRIRYTYTKQYESMLNRCRWFYESLSDPSQTKLLFKETTLLFVTRDSTILAVFTYQLLEMPMTLTESGWGENICTETYLHTNWKCICNHLGSNEGTCAYLFHLIIKQYWCLGIFSKQL